jgi:hypothetical protein
MGDFSTDWLTLREPMDQRSRNVSLTERLIAWRKAFDKLSILDLGTGTGSNVRYLLPKLTGRQRWLLIDKDDDLLTHLQPRMAQWAKETGLQLSQDGSDLVIQGDDCYCRLKNHSVDLRDGLEQCPQKPNLVTASAFLDLVSSAWMNKVALYCQRMNAAFFVVLTYNGIIRWDPTDKDDEWICHTVNAHQRTDKGFGPALGPDGASYGATCFQGYGYQVFTQPSHWQLGAAANALQMVLVRGYAEAAQQQEPTATVRIDEWLARRQHAIAASQSRLTVGHIDLFAYSSWRDTDTTCC